MPFTWLFTWYFNALLTYISQMLDMTTLLCSHQLMKTACLRMGRLTIAGLRQISIGARLERPRRTQLRLLLAAMFEQNSNPKVSSKDYFAPRICALRHASALKCGSFGPKSPFRIPPDIPSRDRLHPSSVPYRGLPCIAVCQKLSIRPLLARAISARLRTNVRTCLTPHFLRWRIFLASC